MKKITILLLLMVFVSSGVVLAQGLSPNATHEEKIAYDLATTQVQPAQVTPPSIYSVSGDRAMVLEENFDGTAFPPPGWSEYQYQPGTHFGAWERSTNVGRHLACLVKVVLLLQTAMAIPVHVTM